MELDKFPNSSVLREEEVVYYNAYRSACMDEEIFLKQKSKIEWLKEGDQNNAYFHNAIKGRLSKSRIDSIYDDEGKCFTGSDVPGQFVQHFQNIFGIEGEIYPVDDPVGLFSKKISDEQALKMISPFSNEEIKSAIFDIEDNKAPGPDGFTARFFKAAWDVVGSDVCKAVKVFFQNGKMLGELNTTIISLVPKSKNPKKVSDYRPIACCGVVCK